MMHTMRVTRRARALGYTGVRSTPYAPRDLGPDGELVLVDPTPDPTDDQEMGNMDPPTAAPAGDVEPAGGSLVTAQDAANVLGYGLAAVGLVAVLAVGGLIYWFTRRK